MDTHYSVFVMSRKVFSSHCQAWYFKGYAVGVCLEYAVAESHLIRFVIYDPMTKFIFKKINVDSIMILLYLVSRSTEKNVTKWFYYKDAFV